jgi:hypothetical protein
VTQFHWRTDALSLTFGYEDAAPVALRSLRPAGAAAVPATTGRLDQPLVEVSATGHGRFPGGFRHVDTVLGAALRYVGHAEAHLGEHNSC